MNNDQDAEDIVQESAVRAFNTLKSMRGDDGKAWFLAIVRHGSYNKLRQRRSAKNFELPLDDALVDPGGESQQEWIIRAWEESEVRSAILDLPCEYREVVVLRELEDMSYKQISEVTGLPIGTVMSRLARARERLRKALTLSIAGEEK